MNETTVALGLGGNLGNVAETFRQAAKELAQAGLKHIVISSFYSTEPVGCAPGTPDFINAVLSATWKGTVEELHEICKNLEVKFGRPRDHERYVSRTLDLDIIFFGQEIINTPELTIPHREAANRLFVLVPLAEIAGDWNFPGKNKKIADILTPLKGRDEYRQMLKNAFK